MPYPYLSRKDVVNEAILKASKKKTGDKFTLPDLFRNTLPSGVTEWEQIQIDFHNKGFVISRMFAKNASSLIQPLQSPRKKIRGRVVFTRK